MSVSLAKIFRKFLSSCGLSIVVVCGCDFDFLMWLMVSLWVVGGLQQNVARLVNHTATVPETIAMQWGPRLAQLNPLLHALVHNLLAGAVPFTGVVQPVVLKVV